MSALRCGPGNVDSYLYKATDPFYVHWQQAAAKKKEESKWWCGPLAIFSHVFWIACPGFVVMVHSPPPPPELLGQPWPSIHGYRKGTTITLSHNLGGNHKLCDSNPRGIDLLTIVQNLYSVCHRHNHGPTKDAIQRVLRSHQRTLQATRRRWYHPKAKKKKSERGVAIRGIFFILYTSRSMGHFLFLTDFVSFCIFLWDANAAQSGSRIEQISNPSTKLELYVICV